ncbi:hypothetical protein PVL29_012206 [Vitis rotundifolia]|uniref:Uncharacterized protein n=1 Tax=Vitis rotundifolia TaxID=103349 RepID=A0AA38ZQY9_VITRO|nr:hypothetical protein PVL29_012206 [Vitis rotundifolia]
MQYWKGRMLAGSAVIEVKMKHIGFVNSHKKWLGYLNDVCLILPVAGFERLSALKKLEILMLDHNCLNNSILPYLSTLTSLKNLSLSYNSLSGWFPPDGISYYVSLKILNIYSLFSMYACMHFLTSIFLWAELATLVNLEILDVSWNEFKPAQTVKGKPANPKNTK